MFGFINFLLVIGLVAGFIARALVPGNDSMSVVAAADLQNRLGSNPTR